MMRAVEFAFPRKSVELVFEPWLADYRNRTRDLEADFGHRRRVKDRWLAHSFLLARRHREAVLLKGNNFDDYIDRHQLLGDGTTRHWDEN